jgi:cyclase
VSRRRTGGKGSGRRALERASAATRVPPPSIEEVQAIAARSGRSASSMLFARGTSRGATGLTARVIPCLDVAGGRVVKGVQFQNLRDQGDPAACALRYADDGADEIVFLDITAAPERRRTNLDWVTRTAERVFIPLTVGGGVRSVEDGRALLLAGADKVGVNTAAVEDPELLTRLAERFGSQCVVLSVDARRRVEGGGDAAAPEHAGEEEAAAGEGTGAGAGATAAAERGSGPRREAASVGWRTAAAVKNSDPDVAAALPRWEVVTHGGRTATGRDALEWIAEGVARGAGEILLTSIDADGTQAGYDLDLLAAVCASVTVPVVASGGAGTVDHLADALGAGASAVLAASIFHQATYTPDQVKRELAARGFPMRLEVRS